MSAQRAIVSLNDMALDINADLPDDLDEGDLALPLSSEIVDLAFRKINAIHNARAVYPLVLVKSDGGFLFYLAE